MNVHRQTEPTRKAVLTLAGGKIIGNYLVRDWHVFYVMSRKLNIVSKAMSLNPTRKKLTILVKRCRIYKNSNVLCEYLGILYV